MESWSYKKFSEVCILQRGFDLPKSERKPGKYPLISSSGYIDFHSEAKVSGPGVVTGRSGSIGQIFYIPEDFWPLNTALYVKNFLGNDPRFISYFLKQFDLGRYISGAGVPTLNRNHVHDEQVFVPNSVKEQKHIVAILDQVFSDIEQARAKTEQNLKNARELFESYLQQVFSERSDGSPQVALSEITECISDGDHAAPPKSDEGIPFITISNINKSTNEIDFSNTFKVPNAYYSALKETRRPKRGDVLYTVTGSYGIPVIVRDEKEFCFQRHIGLVRPNKDVDSDWLYYLLMSPQIFRQADEGATGTAQKTVSLKLLRGLSVPNIPLRAQKKMVNDLNSMYRKSKTLEKIYISKLLSLEELKKSILQQAFTGQLTNKKGKGVAA